ncbi:MAG: class I SAM-dependent methyltransferase, partial [Spirochaetota bacterium]
LDHNVDETPVQRELRERTATMPEADLQIAPEQAAFLRLLVTLAGAKRTIEVGVFTGYSAMAVALALPEDGRIVACDVNEEWTAIAREYWKKEQIDDRIDLRIAPAVETLDTLIAEGQAGEFDFAFVDADKVSYPVYYERCLELLRPGGLIAMDNALRRGRVAGAATHAPDDAAVREVNRRAHADSRVVSALVNVADGMLLAVKR